MQPAALQYNGEHNERHHLSRLKRSDALTNYLCVWLQSLYLVIFIHCVPGISWRGSSVEYAP